MIAGIAALALGLSAAALGVAASSPWGDGNLADGGLHALLVAVPVGVGLYALERDPSSRFARLLIGAGFLWAPSMLAASGNSVLYSIGRISGWLVLLSLVGLLLSFPSGRLERRADRWLVGATLGVLLLLYLPAVPLSVHFNSPSPWSTCLHNCPPNAFSAVHSEPDFVGSVLEPLQELAAVVLFTAAALTVALKLRRTSEPMRTTLLPAVVGAVLTFGTFTAFLIARREDQWSSFTRLLGYLAVLSIPALLMLLLAGLLRWRFVAMSAFQQLAGQYDNATSGATLRDLIAGAIHDPTLEIAYWTGTPGRWVDGTGNPRSLPVDDPHRAITQIDSHDGRVAALIYDSALSAEPTLREVAGGFALMALENLRLDAELRSSLRELRESRARILSAVDQERQRIERDLHDGAQQRLVALRVALQVAGEALERDPDAGGELFASLGADVEKTLDEVRALARGVYPPLLADHGIGEALRMAARTSSLPTTVSSRGIGRYSQQVESAVYFCCLEALQNAAKHSGARKARIKLTEGEELRFEVSDDGGGFAPGATRRAGLDNMRDRIVSLGGRLTIESEPGEGTRVMGTVPVGLAQLTPDVAMLLQRATDALDDCFGIYRAVRDGSGKIVDFAAEHVNDAAARDAGRPREVMIGRTLGYLNRDYVGSELFEWHCKALESDGPSSLDDAMYERGPEGRHLRKAYEVRAVPIGASRLAVTWRDITARKLVEDDLLLKSTALGWATEGVCLVRASDGMIVYANPSFDQIFGYERGELLGRQAAELDWEAHPGAVKCPPRDVLAELDGRGEGPHELRNRRKDGTPVWTELHLTSFDHPDHGKVWVAVQQDVTERKKVEEALLLSDWRVRQAMHGVPLVLYTMDSDLRYTWVFNNQVGLRGDDTAAGKTDRELLGEVAAMRLSALNRRALAGESVRTEVELPLPRGPCTFEVNVGPRRDERGRVVGVAGAAYDLTPRMRVGRFDRLAEQSPIGMAILAGDLRIMDANQAFGALLGHAPELLRHMALTDVTYEDGRVNELVDLLLISGRAVHDTTLTFVTRDGEPAVASVLAFRLDDQRDPGGVAIALVVRAPEGAERSPHSVEGAGQA